MKGQRILTLVVALACISAAGITASTLESSLETDPDEVIDFQYDYLPFGKDDVSNTKEEAYHNEQNDQSGGGGGGSNSGRGNVDTPPTCSPGPVVDFLATLLWFIGPCMSMFYVLGMFVPFVFGLGMVGLTHRYRYRLLAPGFAVMSWLIAWTPFQGRAGKTTWPSEPPTNEVHRAWLAMVHKADIDQPWTHTPGACARAAIDVGLDSEAVTAITALFEEVRYGKDPVTDEHRQQAREWRHRLEDNN